MARDSPRPRRAAAVAVVVAEPTLAYRDALVRALARTEALSAMGVARDGAEALALVERVRPDVLVADVRLRGRGGLELAALFAERGSRTRVVITTTTGDEVLARRAEELGAAALVDKGASWAAVRDTIAGAAQGAGFRFERSQV